MENKDILMVKNYLSDEEIIKIYKHNFRNSSDNLIIKKLIGGLKNSVYLIEDNERKIVLKIASADRKKTLTLDRDTMWWEARMLKLLEKLDVPTPILYRFDETCNLCEFPYIFMSYLEGDNYLNIKENLSIEVINNIERELGKFSKQISLITNDEYFVPIFLGCNINSNYQLIKMLFLTLLEDAKIKNIQIDNITYQDIVDLVDDYKEELNDVDKIVLCHTDLWDGNILVKDGKVSGILDFSDLYFGDELLTFYFHTVENYISNYYLEGYDKNGFSYSEEIRIEIYGLFTLLKMLVDVEFKGYGRYEWMYEKFNAKYKKLKKICYNENDWRGYR